jgi:RNA polymerase sigma-70 factor (ECF subfamily)
MFSSRSPYFFVTFTTFCVINPKPLISNDVLIAGCIKGDRQFQKALYDRFAPKMFGHCLRYSGNKDDAQDLLQDGFIKVFDSISALKNPQQLEGWMTRVFINLALSRYRKERSGPQFQELPESDQLPEEETSEPLPVLELSEVLACLHALPPTYATVLNLYAIDQLPHREIAELMGVSEGNAKTLLSRGRKMLKEELKKRKK